MRLDRLKVDGFKNLNNVEIDFDENELSTVLVGLNGTGKSNVLEAIVHIFRSLDLREAIPFKCYIRYECNSTWIVIDNRWDKESSQVVITVDGKGIPLTKFYEKSDEYLPRHIFGYYSGGTRRFEVLFDKHQTRYYGNIIKPGAESEVEPRQPALRRLFYARPFYGQLSLLTHFARDPSAAPAFLKRDMQIVGFHSALIVMKRPSWARTTPNALFRQHGDPRFWYATGVVRHLLTALWEHAIAPMRITDTVQEDYRERPRSEEHIYIFIKDQETLQKIAEPFGSQQTFFSMLETLDISGLVREVKVWVNREGAGDELPFHEISDGEKQLLTVLGLMKFTGHEQSLYLLDEPDTHLNPAWKRDYLNLIEEVAEKHINSHLIMTSHDALTISGLEAKQIQVLSRDASGKVRASQATIDPRGLGVSGILTEIFGLLSTLDQETQTALDKRNALFAIPSEERTPQDIETLEELTERLANLGFRQASREPMYERFLRGMQRRGVGAHAVFSPDEVSALNAIADEIINELVAGAGDDIH